MMARHPSLKHRLSHYGNRLLTAPLWLRLLLAALFILLMLLPELAWAKLPEPTPEQTRAAAEKKAQTDATAEEDKKKLATKIDEVSQRWRERATKEGWKANAPAPAKAAQGSDASSKQSSASGQPGGQQGAQQGAKQGDPAKALPIQSEKLGTAAPSKDVKQPESTRPVK